MIVLQFLGFVALLVMLVALVVAIVWFDNRNGSDVVPTPAAPAERAAEPQPSRSQPSGGEGEPAYAST
jgi:hypothetical protein